ncbi:protein DEHYDRATION-INDUCED 19 homolog 3 [Medicago truncatula]|uniref:protein DEHYDRATION-INDUCED 19 homolog 3 n=1 Tax=Medicago truncatula TaxID=3880 RepID=UPI000D2F19A5|nr:protein DEHYDRATION-INDUCED 19 homolog 3 [Medicago truncatula]
MEDETSKSYQSRLKSHLELLIDFEEVNGDEELMTIYPCPFCEEDFDLLELCFHIDLDHPIEAESGICPVCAMWVGTNIVDHITAQHGDLFKSHLKSKSHKHDSYQTLSFSRKGRRDGHWKSCSDELSPVMPTSKTTCDPFLSFLCGATASGEHENVQLDSSSEASIEEIHSHDTVLERDVPPSLSHKDQVEKARRSEFVQGLLLSTILDPDL